MASCTGSTLFTPSIAKIAIPARKQFSNDTTTVTIQFDSHVRNSDGALVDGNYQLTLTGSLVTRAGVPMSEDFVFGDVEAHAFYCFYGDTNADRDNNIFDLLAFRQSYNTVIGAAG